jgi:hypothetical protein
MNFTAIRSSVPTYGADRFYKVYGRLGVRASKNFCGRHKEQSKRELQSLGNQNLRPGVRNGRRAPIFIT